MSLLNTFFAAVDDAAALQAVGAGAAVGYESGGLTNIEIETLAETLGVDDPADACVLVAHLGERWLFRLHPSLTAALDALDIEATVAGAAGWARTDEMSGADPAVLSEVLAGIAAQGRVAAGGPVYFLLGL